MLVLLHPVTSPKPHLQCEEGKEPGGSPPFPAAGPDGGQPFSRSRSTWELCHAPSEAAKATSRSSGYGGLSAEFSNCSVGFPSEWDKKEALLLLFCLDPVQADSARCNEGPLSGGASTFPPHGRFSSNTPDVPGYPATLADPL